MSKKKEKLNRGVSLIALVITIIVVIILAAIAFGTSTRTITNANYSDYVNNVGEVYSAFHTRAVTIKGQEAAKGNSVTDAQVYHYLADNSGEFAVRGALPSYTVIKDEGQIGMDLPKMRLEAATGKMVDMQYAVTSSGEIFTWPPLEYEGALKINSKDTVEAKDSETIKVGEMTFTITLDENKMLAVGTAGGSTVTPEPGTTTTPTPTPTPSNGLTFILPSGKTKTTLVAGDLITISGETLREQFYYVGSDKNNSSKAVLLAKDKIVAVPGTTEYLTQSVSASGQPIQASYTYEHSYWSGDALSKGFTEDPYDGLYDFPITINVTGSGEHRALYAAQEYGKQYEATGRLLTKGEIDEIRGGLAPSAVVNEEGTYWLKTGYIWWLGSAYSSSSAWLVSSSGSLNNANPNNSLGVRPVIVITIP